MSQPFVIDDLEQLKALAAPLRRRLLMAFCCQPATTKQVAEQLGEKPTRLYHHVELLEQAGLIRLVETRPNRGTVEKYYQAVADQLVIDYRLLQMAGGEASGAQAAFIQELQTCLNEAQRSFDLQATSGERRAPAQLSRLQLRLSEIQALALTEKICAWLQECETWDNSDAGDQTYSLVIALFPLRDQAADDNQEDSTIRCC